MDSSILLVSDESREPWLHSRPWDTSWLIGSVVIVPMVLLLVWSGMSNDWLNLGVTALVGGPHLFATYTATYLDRGFRKSHRWLLLVTAIVVPAFVIYFTIQHFQVLLSVFIFAASIHVLQQNAYISDMYRRKARVPESPWARWIDYGFVGLSFYPIAAYKLVTGSFLLGDVKILIPDAFMNPKTYWLVATLFALFAVAWIRKTVAEARGGTLNLPKTLLLGVTAFVAFLVPMAGTGERLELAFQSINAWHSFQYLGLVWLLQRKRAAIGDIAMSSTPWRFYGVCFGASAALLLAMLGLSRLDPFGLSFNHYYYMGVLSCLLIHYVLDAYLFTASNAGRSNPYAVLAET